MDSFPIVCVLDEALDDRSDERPPESVVRDTSSWMRREGVTDRTFFALDSRESESVMNTNDHVHFFSRTRVAIDRFVFLFQPRCQHALAPHTPLLDV
jgi:hypothetical protein